MADTETAQTPPKTVLYCGGKLYPGSIFGFAVVNLSTVCSLPPEVCFIPTFAPPAPRAPALTSATVLRVRQLQD